MAKETREFSTAELRSFTNRWRLVAAKLDAATDTLEQCGYCSADVRDWKSLERGIKALTTFSKSVHAAIDELLLAVPAIEGKADPGVEDQE